MSNQTWPRSRLWKAQWPSLRSVLQTISMASLRRSSLGAVMYGAR